MGKIYKYNPRRHLESFSFKLRMLHDTGMIHSRYIRDAF